MSQNSHHHLSGLCPAPHITHIAQAHPGGNLRVTLRNLRYRHIKTREGARTFYVCPTRGLSSATHSHHCVHQRSLTGSLTLPGGELPPSLSPPLLRCAPHWRIHHRRQRASPQSSKTSSHGCLSLPFSPCRHGSSHHHHTCPPPASVSVLVTPQIAALCEPNARRACAASRRCPYA